MKIGNSGTAERLLRGGRRGAKSTLRQSITGLATGLRARLETVTFTM
jgi:hypothetical protein